MKEERFECDSCGKVRVIGLEVQGWLDVAEIVLATVNEQRRWQFCSGLCLSIFAGGYVPAKAVTKQEPSMEKKIQEAIGQYL